jgi:hypothetical protein
MVVYRADLQAAAALGRPPLLPLIYDLKEVASPSGLLEEANNPTLDHLEMSAPCSTALKEVFLLLRQVILGQRDKVMSAKDIAILLNTVDKIILDNIEFHPLLTVEERRSKAMLVAAHVLSHVALRKWPRTGPVARALVSRLMGILSAPEVDLLAWLGHLPCLLWTLAIGAVAAEGGMDGMANWFTAKFQNLVQSLGLKTESDLERSLKLFVWDESFSKVFSHKFWIQVQPAAPSRSVDA